MTISCILVKKRRVNEKLMWHSKSEKCFLYTSSSLTIRCLYYKFNSLKCYLKFTRLYAYIYVCYEENFLRHETYKYICIWYKSQCMWVWDNDDLKVRFGTLYNTICHDWLKTQM